MDIHNTVTQTQGMRGAQWNQNQQDINETKNKSEEQHHHRIGETHQSSSLSFYL